MGLFAVGCGDSVVEPVVSEPIRLTRAQNCADLEAMLKQDALIKMNAQIDAMIASSENYNNNDGVLFGNEQDAVSVGASGGDPPSPTGVPETDDAAGGPDHSDTNTQVEGVDEADIVKTDGNFIYLLHGQSLDIITAWPASSLAVSGSTDIEGQPLEMFVADDTIVVYSSVNGEEVLKKAGQEPRSEYYDGYYGGGFGGAESPPGDGY